MIIAGTVYGHQNEYEEFVVDLVDSLPSSGVTAQMVWNVGDGNLYIYDGTNWRAIAIFGGDAVFNTLVVYGDATLGRHLRTNDELITLNYGEDGSNITGTNTDTYQWGTYRAGIEVDRGTSPTVSLFYNEQTDRWSLTNDGSLTEIIMSFDPDTGTGVANDYFLRLDGGNVPTNDISWADNRITDLGEPVDLHDAANKIFAIKMAIVLG